MTRKYVECFLPYATSLAAVPSTNHRFKAGIDGSFGIEY